MLRVVKMLSLAPLALTLAVVGCSKSNTPAVVQNAQDQADKAVKQTALSSSKYTTGCAKTNAAASFFGIPSETEVYDMGASLSKTTTLFREDNCATPAVGIVENGNYTLGDKVADQTYQLNEHYDSVGITPITADGAKALNDILACGFTDWTVGVQKVVTAQSSSTPVVSRCWVKTPRDIFDIVQITGSQIRFGLVENGLDTTSPDKRPVRIDQTVTLSKP